MRSWGFFDRLCPVSFPHRYRRAPTVAWFFRRACRVTALGPALLLLSVLPSPLLVAEESPPVDLVWGVPEHVEMGVFAGLQREPQAREHLLDGVGRTGQEELTLVWRRGESYVVPLFASSEHVLNGIRYYGYGIPAHVELEWLDPWNREWYPLEKIPDTIIRLQVFRFAGEDHPADLDGDESAAGADRSAGDGTISIDFGPPEGAEFHRELSRFIWFRVTPHRTGTFALRIFGYDMAYDSPGETGFPDPETVSAVSNTVLLRAEVHERD